MAIIMKPKQSKQSAEDFIKGAPDAAKSEVVIKGVTLGKQSQISFAMPPELLVKVDETARKLSISRAAFMKMAITRAVQHEMQG